MIMNKYFENPTVLNEYMNKYFFNMNI